jgi:hypothetical protein
MGDFVQRTVVKSAVRTFTNPIPDFATFNTIINSFYDHCWGHEEEVEPLAGVHSAIAAIVQNNGDFTGKVTVSTFHKDITTHILDMLNTNPSFVSTFMGGGAGADGGLYEDVSKRTPIASRYMFKCRGSRGTFTVVHTNEQMRINSYTDNSVLTGLEAWADGLPALA